MPSTLHPPLPCAFRPSRAANRQLHRGYKAAGKDGSRRGRRAGAHKSRLALGWHQNVGSGWSRLQQSLAANRGAGGVYCVARQSPGGACVWQKGCHKRGGVPRCGGGLACRGLRGLRGAGPCSLLLLLLLAAKKGRQLKFDGQLKLEALHAPQALHSGRKGVQTQRCSERWLQ